jgi:hypothetical protein
MHVRRTASRASPALASAIVCLLPVAWLVLGCTFAPEEGLWDFDFHLDSDDCGQGSADRSTRYTLSLRQGSLVFDWGEYICSLESREYDCWFGLMADGMYGLGTSMFEDAWRGQFSDSMTASGTSLWGLTWIDDDGMEQTCETGWLFEAVLVGD